MVTYSYMITFDIVCTYRDIHKEIFYKLKTSMSTHIYICVRTYACMYYVCMYVCIMYTLCMYVYIYMCVYIYVFMYVCMYIYVCVYTYTMRLAFVVQLLGAR